MKNSVQDILNQFATALLTRNQDSLAKLCAPWVEIDQVLSAIESKANEVRSELDDIGPMDSFELDDNFCGVVELRDDGIALANEVTESNFELWACVTIFAADGEWSLGDIWCAVIHQQEEQYLIGHVEIEDPD